MPQLGCPAAVASFARTVPLGAASPASVGNEATGSAPASSRIFFTAASLVRELHAPRELGGAEHERAPMPERHRRPC
jgi:hypothetical protein